jgi:D-amino-acid oxidase
MQITIIGSGVSGLSCAVRLLEAGHDVCVWARDLPPHTTSNVAAAVWYPYKAFPEALVLGWSATTYAELARLAAEAPQSGVIVRGGLELFRAPEPDPWWKAAVPSFRRATPAELPAGFAAGFAFQAPVIEMPVYLGYLAERATKGGGVIERRTPQSLDEALGDADVVVNCAGLGARELVGDTSMVPIRGQIVRVAQVGLEQFILDDHGPAGVTYIVPRTRDIILGGTAHEHNENLTPDPPTAAAILARCQVLEPRLRDAMVLEHRVGLRPGRPAVRLEAEPRGRALLVHNYGHGGAGVTLSWGCADEVVRLLERW